LNIDIWLETNGTLVTREKARMLAGYWVGHVSVSLDSAFEEMHDSFRGHKGAFRRTLDGIRNLMEEGLIPQVIMSLYRENLNDFGHFLGLMKELGIRSVKVNTISMIGKGCDLRTAGGAPSVREVLDFVEKAGSMSKEAGISALFDIPMAFQSLGDVKRNRCAICAVKNILGILSDGTVSLCGIGYLDKKLKLGNIKNNPDALRDIWLNDPVLWSIREDMPSALEGVCGMCVFKAKCLGSCRAEAYYNTGGLTTSPCLFCQEAYEKGLFPATRLIPEAMQTR
jgi:SynChlorMet cassette radical SAM/SPASM protein ScmF